MNCPACSRHGIRRALLEIWEFRKPAGPRSQGHFTGVYSCPAHGMLRLSGKEIEGADRVCHFHPACPEHGTEHVVQVNDTGRDFCCHRCGRRFEVTRHEVRTVWQPESSASAPPSAVPPFPAGKEFSQCSA